MKLLSKSMTGEELGRVIISSLSTLYGINSHRLVAAMRDRASVNNVAMGVLKLLYPDVLDVGCFSHTLDRVGSHFSIPVADDFTKLWISLFSRSPKARLAWRSLCGRPIPSYSETRWWSRWEVMKQISEAFPDVENFVQSSDNLSPATVRKLKEILNDPLKKTQLKIELSVVVDAGALFVKATYNLEGDGSLVLSAYEELRKIYHFISVPHYPNLTACVQQMTHSNTTAQQQLTSYAESCVKPGFDYFKSKFDGDLKPLLTFFKCARLFSPTKVKDIQIDSSTIDELASSLPSMNNLSTITGLKSELPAYLAAVEDIDPSVDTLSWWKGHEEDLPNFCSAFKDVLLVQPSSAAAERVFSLLQNSFSQRQSSSLEDYIESSIMLQYNR